MSHKFVLSIGFVLFAFGATVIAVQAQGATPPKRGPSINPNPPAFYVNSTDDSNIANTVLTLREAILLANGGTGGDGVNTGLGRALTAGEQAQTANCTIDVSGLITGGCGAGFKNTIYFDSSLGSNPIITLGGDLPIVQNTQPTVINGTGSYPIVNANGDSLPIKSSGNLVEYLTVENGGVSAIHVFGTNNILSFITVTTSANRGIFIDTGGDSTSVLTSTIQGNSSDGIDVETAGSLSILGNTILSNSVGVFLNNSNSNNIGGNTIISNVIGVHVTGTSQSNKIGGPSFGSSLSGNLISGNTSTGVALEGTGSLNLVAGNRIGTTADGLSADPNITGISVGSNGNYIGDPAAVSNIISGNFHDGVYVSQLVHGNQIANNRIGLGASLGALPNLGNGIELVGALTTTISGNLIGYNKGPGISLDNGVNSNASGNQIQNNTIEFNGTQGVTLLGNLAYGAINNTITGGSIHDNVGAGIYEGQYASQNSWTQISTYNNGGLGISKFSATPAHPSIASVTRNGAQWTISGTVTAGSLFNPVSVEVYSVVPDPSGFGQGKTYLGVASVNNTGNWSLNTPLSNSGCFSAFETTSSLILTTAASSDFSKNSCGVGLFLPLIMK